MQKHKRLSCLVVKCNTYSIVTNTTNSDFFFAEAELCALTTGVVEGMVTKHFVQELGREVILMNHVDSQASKSRPFKKGLGKSNM